MKSPMLYALARNTYKTYSPLPYCLRQHIPLYTCIVPVILSLNSTSLYKEYYRLQIDPFLYFQEKMHQITIFL